MAESSMHIGLVRLLFDYVRTIYFCDDSGSIFIDLPESSRQEKPPPIIDQYRPDLYSSSRNTIIIGEAKTEKDLESVHSALQLESYLRTCEIFDGCSYLVVSVPCFHEAFARNQLKRICKKYNVTKTRCIVISPLENWRERFAKNNT